MKKLAFTIIELLVVMGIIALMVLFTAPSMSGYAKKNDYLNKIDELKSIVDQARVSAKNSEKDKDRYEVIVDASTKKAVLYKTTLDSLQSPDPEKEEVRSVQFSSKTSLAVSGSKTIFACDAPGEACCLYAAARESVKCGNNPIEGDKANIPWIGISSTDFPAITRTLNFQNYIPYVQ